MWYITFSPEKLMYQQQRRIHSIAVYQYLNSVQLGNTPKMWKLTYCPSCKCLHLRSVIIPPRCAVYRYKICWHNPDCPSFHSYKISHSLFPSQLPLLIPTDGRNHGYNSHIRSSVCLCWRSQIPRNPLLHWDAWWYINSPLLTRPLAHSNRRSTTAFNNVYSTWKNRNRTAHWRKSGCLGHVIHERILSNWLRLYWG
jgi:hypothetical protein